MCTYITEKADIAGSGKGHRDWFPLLHANVYYDHPFHAPFDHALTIDFVNETQGPDARVAVEMSAESARELSRKIYAALGATEDQPGVGEPEICTGIVEKAEMFGSGKGPQGWFTMRWANVYYDQPSHAPMLTALNMDFVNEAQGPDARVAVELSAESAREVARKIHAALEAGAAQHLLERG
jgi:hypothetical protein